MAGFRICFVSLAAAVSLLDAAGVGQAGSHPSGAPGAARLRILLAEAHVPLRRGSTPAAPSFPVAWKTFQQFARIPVDDRDDDLLFEYGVFESHFWGTSFEVELTRQYRLASGDLQQVHLVVHFPVAAFIAIRHSFRAAPCLRSAQCVFRCFFSGDDALAPHPCKVVPSDAGGYRVGDMTLRASQTGTSDLSAQRTRWVAAVESSPVLRALLSRQVRPDGYEVWQESAG